MIKTYQKLGWATFPCHGKVPATKRGFHEADITGEVFKKYKGENVGVASGDVSGVWILDIDIKKNAGGAESLAALVEKYGPLPITVESRTWSGGTHYYFKMPSCGMGNRTNVFKGIDVRGSGGYVIAPPSTIEGKPYEWINTPELTDVAEAPIWLINLLKEKVNPERQNDPTGKIIEGQRNQELTSKAGKLRSVGLSSHEIYVALQRLNLDYCDPPLPDKEVRTISESVGRYEYTNINAPLTDLWNSERFVERYGRDIRYCDTLGGWFTWTGRTWKQTNDNTLMRYAKDFVKELSRQADITANKSLKSHAIKSEAAGKLAGIVELAKSEHGVLLDSKDFDKNNNLLNCANGTLDLDSGKIIETKREDYISKEVELIYDTAASCPIWLSFLNDIFQANDELIDYVQRALGYSLSGYTTEQKFFLCVGNGRNGKSTLLKHIQYVLGNHYSTGTPAQTMLECDGNTLHAIAALKGMRLVVLSEFDEGKVLSSAQVKNLTGGEPVVARHLYHQQFTYVPTSKFWLSTNFKPRIRDMSLGIWRRLVILPFDYTIPLEKMDTNLDDKLKPEHPGILAWAVEGYRKWRKDGLPALERLKSVATYYQSDSDLIGQFLADCLDTEVDPAQAEVAVQDFIKFFQNWCTENGIKYYPSRSSILDYMDKKGYGRPIREDKGLIRGRLAWRGISIKRMEANYKTSIYE